MTAVTERSAKRLPGYELLRPIGQGGMGAVYLARQLAMDREVAVKILPPALAARPGFKERFLREARAAGRLNHPNIVAAYDCQDAGGFVFLAMEYVAGGSLADRLKASGALPEREAARLIRQIAGGLAHAWAAGLVHRDVKPENFLIATDGTAKLCDLGVAHASDLDLAAADAEAGAGVFRAGLAIGTPRYISPEQARGLTELDWRSDAYSLGASFFHALTGASPFDAPDGRAMMVQHVSLPPPTVRARQPAASAGAEAVVARLLAKDPADRYAAPEELLADLDALADGRSPPSLLRDRPTDTRLSPVCGVDGPEPPESLAGRHQGWLVAGAVAVAIVAVIVGGRLLGGPGPNEQAAALYRQASHSRDSGRLDEAIRSFDEVARRWPLTPYAETAQKEAVRLRRLADDSAPERRP